MPWSEIIFGSLLAALLLLLGLFFGWRQLAELRRLRAISLPDEEARYERRKAVRRLVSCGLLLLLGLLLGGQMAFYGPRIQELVDRHDRRAEGEPRPTLSDEEKGVARSWGWSIVAMLVVLLAVVILAGIDLLATRRHALRLFRKLQADRRAMIHRQTNRLRQERDGA